MAPIHLVYDLHVGWLRNKVSPLLECPFDRKGLELVKLDLTICIWPISALFQQNVSVCIIVDQDSHVA